MRGVFSALRKILFEGSMHSRFYLRYLCEETIAQVFALVVNARQVDFYKREGYELIKISEASGVQQFLAMATTAISPTSDGQTFFERHFRPFVVKDHARTLEAPRWLQERGVVKREDEVVVKKGDLPCKAHLLHVLGVTNLQGAVFNGCRVQQCGFKHVDVSMESKRNLHVLINNLSKKRGAQGEIPAVLTAEVAKSAHDAVTRRK